MKKIFFVLLMAFSFAFAESNIPIFIESSKAWTGAINAGSGVSLDRCIYIPDYGFAIGGNASIDDQENIKKIVNTVQNLTLALSSTVKGADANDWISFNIYNLFGDNTMVLREKFSDLGKIDKWEVWINGKKQ